MTPVYLDYNATAPVRPAVIEAVAAAMALPGNPSSVHGPGRQARAAIERARQTVANLVGTAPAYVVFTSGGTEANNLALAGRQAIASPIEHDSVLGASRPGTYLPLLSKGVVDLEALDDALVRHRPAMIAVMLANNETGVIQPVAEIAAIARKYGIRVHCDAIQAVGKIPVDMAALGVASLSLSGHKFGGPSGIGALVLSAECEDDARPLLKGGAQERRLRPGTENMPGIAGLGMAAMLALTDHALYQDVARLRDELETGVLAIAPDARIFGKECLRLPTTSCLAMPGVANSTQLMAFDLAKIAVSTGAACSSGKVGPSHVLAAMNVSEDIAATAIRVSLGWNSKKSDVARFVATWRDLYERTRRRAGSAHAS